MIERLISARFLGRGLLYVGLPLCAGWFLFTGLASYYYRQGKGQMEQRHYAEAREALRKSIDWNSLRAEPHFLLAQTAYLESSLTEDGQALIDAGKWITQAKNRYDHDFEMDLLRLKITHRMKPIPQEKLERILYRLNQKYPHNLVLQFHYFSVVVPYWPVLDKERRETLLNYGRTLLNEDFLSHRIVLRWLARYSRDFTVVRSVMPDRLEAYSQLGWILGGEPIKIDFPALWQKSSSPFAEGLPASQLMERWLTNYGQAKDQVDAPNLPGLTLAGEGIEHPGSIYENGYIYAVLKNTGTTRKLTVQAKGSMVAGIPSYMAVAWDGQFLGGAFVTSDWKPYEWQLPDYRSKEMLVQVALVNDFRDETTGEDRNLSVQSISLS